MTAWRWLVLVVVALLALMNVMAPAGLPDTLFLGYDTAHLTDFVQNPEAVAKAAGLSFWLDMVFPALLTFALVWPLSGFWRVPAIVYVVADYIENLTLHRFYLSGGPAPEIAPTLSMVKWIAVAVALVILAIALVRQKRLP